MRLPVVALTLLAIFPAPTSAQTIDDGIKAMAGGRNDEAVAAFRGIDTPEAQYNLGLLAESGRFAGCDRIHCAAEWYLKSARRGLVEGMAAIGRLNYNNGFPDIGIGWLSLAARQGSADAQSMLAQAQNQQLALAQQRAAQSEAARQSQAQAANTMGFLLGCAIAGGGCASSPAPYSSQHGTASLSSRQSIGSQSQCGYVTPSGRVTVIVSGVCPETYAY